ncbi:MULTISPECIES: zinc-binding dehydrogenase [Rhodococcus]|uniref:zinc-binding dehydrogenase n=1 Tax=Rhodococcus TaxID=1827 RepID=UPI000761139B|nr:MULTISPECIES: zinc-binding dehydrogenase [Rhodococcus]MBS9372327.1 2-dehydro-3-deoxy-L-rhamnonate dehydrogenase (NAD(+)) [Rhodococcus sp. B50]
MLCTREQGASTIGVTDLIEHRLAVATRLGADAVSNTLDAGAFDLVIDAVGATVTRSAFLTALRSGGTAVWIGVNDPAATLAASMDVVIAERSIVGSFAYTDAVFAHAVTLSARHNFDWVSTYPLDAAEPVFAELRAERSSIVKAHFTTEDRSQQ